MGTTPRGDHATAARMHELLRLLQGTAWHSAACTCLGLASFLTATPADAGIVTELALDNPTVVIFVPSTVRPEDLGELSGADAWAVQALQRTQVCLSDLYVFYRFMHADTIVASEGARRTSIDVGLAAPLTGALLLKPGANARVIFAGGGPPSLPDLVARAAGDYFEHPCAQ